MPSHRCRIDQVVHQQLDPVATTSGGFSHRCRADWLRVLDLRQANDHLQSWFWQRGSFLSSSRHGGFSGGHLHRLGGSSGSLLSLWCQVLHGHHRWDIAPFDLSACHEKTSASVISDDYDYSSGILQPQQITHLLLRWLQAT
jgi:hypothetical protein